MNVEGGISFESHCSWLLRFCERVRRRDLIDLGLWPLLRTHPECEVSWAKPVKVRAIKGAVAIATAEAPLTRTVSDAAMIKTSTSTTAVRYSTPGFGRHGVTDHPGSGIYPPPPQ
jgi:hypothetical protein